MNYEGYEAKAEELCEKLPYLKHARDCIFAVGGIEVPSNAADAAEKVAVAMARISIALRVYCETLLDADGVSEVASEYLLEYMTEFDTAVGEYRYVVAAEGEDALAGTDNEGWHNTEG